MNKIQILLLTLCISLASSRLLYPSLVKKLAAQRASRPPRPVYLEVNFDSEEPLFPGPKEINTTAHTWAGYFSVYNPPSNSSNASLYFVFYECRNLSAGQNATDVPIIVWLQGGTILFLNLKK